MVPLGPAWPMNELQARWASGVIAGHLKLPPMKDMQEEVSRVNHGTVMKWKKDSVHIYSKSQLFRNVQNMLHEDFV